MAGTGEAESLGHEGERLGGALVQVRAGWTERAVDGDCHQRQGLAIGAAQVGEIDHAGEVGLGHRVCGLASGQADAGVGMALGWLKPLEQGFDVKLTAGLHGGCIRLLTNPQFSIASVADLKGKTVGTSNMASPDRTFIAILAAKNGIDPLKDIDWRIYPPDLLGVALHKGEIQAFSSIDPLGSIIRDRDQLVEVTNNLSGEFANRACCVLGIRASLIRDDRMVAAAITSALMEAQKWVAQNPDKAAEIFASYNKIAPAPQMAAMLRSHTHNHHPVDGELKQEIALYAQEMKQAGVFKQSTDPTQFSERVCVDVLNT